VRRIQQPALCAPRQLAEARGEKGAQGHGARDFAAAFDSARIFFLGGGALGRQPSFMLLARVGRAYSALAVRRRVPPREKCKGGASSRYAGRRHLRACKKGRWHGRIM
jgi:hypothetical protein